MLELFKTIPLCNCRNLCQRSSYLSSVQTVRSSQTAALIIIISIEIRERTTNQLCRFNNKLHRPMQAVHCVAAVAVCCWSPLARMFVHMSIDKKRRGREREKKRERESKAYIIRAIRVSPHISIMSITVICVNKLIVLLFNICTRVKYISKQFITCELDLMLCIYC